MSGPAPCALQERSLGPGALCRGPALFVSLPGTVCRGPALLLCVGARRSVSGPGALCDAGPALCLSGFVSGPGAPCVGARRSCVGPSVGARHSFYRAPDLSVRVIVSVQSSVHFSALCVGAAAVSLCRDPVLRVV